ncbi:MAG: porin family protein [Bacteroidales bacterium]
MKKLIILISLLFVLSITKETFAQYRPIRFGIFASPSITWTKPNTSGYENNGFRIGFSWGLNAEFFLMENYAIESGFKVLFINGKLKYPHQIEITPLVKTSVGTLDRTYNFQYIQIPLCIKMMTHEFGRFRIYGKIGIGTAFRLRAKAKDNFEGEFGFHKSEEKDILKETKLIRESLILGAGTEYDLGGSTRLVLGITFDNALNDILKDQNTVDPNLKHSAITNALELKVGLIF